VFFFFFFNLNLLLILAKLNIKNNISLRNHCAGPLLISFAFSWS